MKYADMEAENYYKQEQDKKVKRDAQRKERQEQDAQQFQRGGAKPARQEYNKEKMPPRERDNRPRRGGPNEADSLNDVHNKTGIAFNSARPVFTRTKPKADVEPVVNEHADQTLGGKTKAAHRVVIDKSQEHPEGEGEQKPKQRRERPPRDHKKGPKQADLEREYEEDRKKHPEDYDEQYDKPMEDRPPKREQKPKQARADGQEEEKTQGGEQAERRGGRGGRNNRRGGGRGDGGQKRYNDEGPTGEGFERTQGQKSTMVYKKVKKVEGDAKAGAGQSKAGAPGKVDLKKTVSSNSANRFSAFDQE